MKKVAIIIGTVVLSMFVIVLVAAAIVTAKVGSIAWIGIFNPVEQNVRREAFEETKSFVHGQIDELAKLYDEYRSADDSGKKIIAELVKMKFNALRPDQINNDVLRKFLVDCRGY